MTYFDCFGMKVKQQQGDLKITIQNSMVFI